MATEALKAGAGSYDVSGRGSVSVCRPLQAQRRKVVQGTGGKKMGSAQPRAQSTGFVFYWFRSRWAYWLGSRWKSFSNGLVLGSHGGDAGNSTSMSSGSGDGEAKSEVGDAPPALARRGRVRLDRVEE